LIGALWGALLLGTMGCSSPLPGTGQGLLAGLRPTASAGATRVQALNDGVQAREGDFWRTELTAILTSAAATVEYDLGGVRPIKAAYLVGDDNDSYVVSTSKDGQSWSELWVAAPTGGRGQQARATDALNGEGRFVRLSARDGDGAYSVSEFAVFSERPAPFPPEFASRVGLPGPDSQRTKILLFAAALVFWLSASTQRWPWFVNVGLGLVPAFAAFALARSFGQGWPVDGREVSLVRGVSGGVAALAILRELLGRVDFGVGRWPASRAVIYAVLAVSASGAAAGFYNLGYPQFQDAKARAPLFVHNFDMRVYFPVAKYFKELRFDGLYMASVAAYVDDDKSVTLESLRNVELRDLRTHNMRRVGEIMPQIQAIPQRFSPERWESFKQDMRYFRETMGTRDYLGSMKDHGGNATPVWLTFANLIFRYTSASNEVLFAAALLDPLLLALAALAIGRVFGIRTGLLAVVVFGANDFYMFGSNWAGATLRHDWMAYLAFGLCALRLRWWGIGGAFLALSALIRAFPAFALVWAAVPAVFWYVDRWRADRSPPTLRELWRTQQPLFRMAIGAALCVAFFFVLSSAMFSFDAWTEWLAKVRLLDRDPHVNHISLRALVAGSGPLQLSILRARMPIFLGAAALIVIVLAVLSRGKPLDQAAALGTLMIPVAFNPANYYMHFVWVLPVLALERKRSEVAHGGAQRYTAHDAGVWMALTLLCAALYWTTWVKDLDTHFQFATVLLFATLAALFAILLHRDWALVTAAPGAAVSAALTSLGFAEPTREDPAARSKPAATSEAPELHAGGAPGVTESSADAAPEATAEDDKPGTDELEATAPSSQSKPVGG
jgi:hypothetical protein